MKKETILIITIITAIIVMFLCSCSNQAAYETEKMIVKEVGTTTVSIKELDPMYIIGDTVTLFKRNLTSNTVVPYKAVVVRKAGVKK